MALVKCVECGREVSDRAAACPGCGAPVARRPAARSTYTSPRWVVALVLVAAFGAMALVVLMDRAGTTRADDALDFSTPTPSVDLAANAKIREQAQQHFRSADPVMVGTWPRPDEFWISVTDRGVDWQQRADGACAWIRAQGMQGRFSVWVVELAALRNKRVEQLAYARCS